jgi:hypothetical protein
MAQTSSMGASHLASPPRISGPRKRAASLRPGYTVTPVAPMPTCIEKCVINGGNVIYVDGGFAGRPANSLLV